MQPQKDLRASLVLWSVCYSRATYILVGHVAFGRYNLVSVSTTQSFDCGAEAAYCNWEHLRFAGFFVWIQGTVVPGPMMGPDALPLLCFLGNFWVRRELRGK